MTDVARWAAALSTLVGLGLSLGLNPALYAATTSVLAQNTRIASRIGGMIVGLALGATALYFLLQTFDPTALVSAAEERASAAVRDARVDAIAGALFLVGAASVVVWKVRAPARPPRPAAAAPRTRPWSYVALGLACSVVGFTTLPIMYMTGRVTEGLSADPALRLAAFAVFLAALAAPFAGLAGAWTLFPSAATTVNGAYARLARTDHRWLYAGVLAAVALTCFGFALVPVR
ncbi:hypothetical protein M3D75_01965 [Microbacterium enclense]|uniref:hypothetical protein n=1 Tax=Microbacterium enclense TaxID=993073 RepID=UPI0021A3834C|nr:hypothetical protein [Microbacterium enclense]MCT2084876.1 hypothetical protein [Microbacterium enclense]